MGRAGRAARSSIKGQHIKGNERSPERERRRGGGGEERGDAPHRKTTDMRLRVELNSRVLRISYSTSAVPEGVVSRTVTVVLVRR